jgi:peptide/nickel transport system substrate-binding protein
LIFYTPDGWGTAYPAGGIYYENPKVTEAVRKGNDSLDMEKQREYYCEAQKQIAKDCPAVFSNSMLRPLPYWRYVKGYKAHVGSMYFDLRYDRYTIDTEDPLFRKNQGW